MTGMMTSLRRILRMIVIMVIMIAMIVMILILVMIVIISGEGCLISSQRFQRGGIPFG